MKFKLKSISLLCVSVTAMYSNGSIAADLKVGDVIATVNSTFYTDQLKVEAITLPVTTHPDSRNVNTYWAAFSESDDVGVKFIFEPNAYLSGSGIDSSSPNRALGFASWSTRLVLPYVQYAYTPPYPFNTLDNMGVTHVIQPDGSYVAPNGVGNVSYPDCDTSTPILVCEPSTGGVEAVGIDNSWYNIYQHIDTNAQETFYSEYFYAQDGYIDDPIYAAAPVWATMTISNTRINKTIALRTEDSVDMGVLRQTGYVTSVEKPFSLATLVDGSLMAIPSGSANVSYSTLTSPSCSGADLALYLDDGSKWVTGSGGQIDANQLASDITANWSAPGTCSGSDSAKLRFTVAWN